MIGQLLLIPLVLNPKSLCQILNNQKKCKNEFLSGETVNHCSNKFRANQSSSWNIFTHNYVNNSDYLETFNQNGYSIRNRHDSRTSQTVLADGNRFAFTSGGYNEIGEEIIHRKGYIPGHKVSNQNDRNIIGTDDRTIIDNPHNYPYVVTGFFEAIFKNIPVVGTDTFIDIVTEGTGFLMGYNLVVTAAHLVYIDPTSGVYMGSGGVEYCVEDNIVNYRIADDMNFYPGANGIMDPLSPEINPIEISIHKNYYIGRDANYDWAMMMTDQDIGSDFGFYGMSINWYSHNHQVYTYGYPSDGNYRMYLSPGKVTNASTYIYTTNLDVQHGNSGGPIIYEYECLPNLKVHYAVGIITSGNASHTYGVRFTPFVGAFINSFLQSYWPSC